MIEYDNRIPDELLKLLEWADRQEPDSATWAILQCRVDELEKADPRFKNLQYMSELALDMYVESLRTRRLPRLSRKQYRFRVERLFRRYRPAIAFEVLYGMLGYFDDPTEALDEGEASMCSQVDREVIRAASAPNRLAEDDPAREMIEDFLTNLADVQDELGRFGRIALENYEALDQAAEVMELKQPKLRDRAYVVAYATLFYTTSLMMHQVPTDPGKDYGAEIWQLSTFFDRPLLVLRVVAEITTVADPDEILKHGSALAAKMCSKA